MLAARVCTAMVSEMAALHRLMAGGGPVRWGFPPHEFGYDNQPRLMQVIVPVPGGGRGGEMAVYEPPGAPPRPADLVPPEARGGLGMGGLGMGAGTGGGLLPPHLRGPHGFGRGW